MVKKALTTTTVKQARLGSTLTDTHPNEGLRLNVSPKGLKTWVYRFRVPSTKALQQIRLGHFPAISLKDARIALAAHKALRFNGLTPIARIEQLEAECDRLKCLVNDTNLAAYKRITPLEMHIEQLEGTLNRLRQWGKAYPLNTFPEPDLNRARRLLENGGITLDAVSASTMRHVVTRVLEITEEKTDDD